MKVVHAWAYEELMVERDRCLDALKAADAYIEHLRTDRGHGDCRRWVGRGHLECGFAVDWKSARSVIEHRLSTDNEIS